MDKDDLRGLLKSMRGPGLGDELDGKFFPLYEELWDTALTTLVMEKQHKITEAKILVDRLETLKLEVELIHKKVYQRINDLCPASLQYDTRKYHDDPDGVVKVYGWDEKHEADYRKAKRAIS